LLRVYYSEGLSGVSDRKWRQELGVRVQGVPHDPLELVRLAVSADRVMEELRLRNRKAFLLAMGVIEHPMDRWFNERGTGVAERLELTLADAQRLYAGAQELVYWRLEVQQEPIEPEPVILGQTLGGSPMN